MARGKYKQRKNNQDAARLATDLARVRAQLRRSSRGWSRCANAPSWMPGCVQT